LIEILKGLKNMKNITLRKHKNYTDEKKVYILSFSKSAKAILNDSNIFTRKLIVQVVTNFLKQEIENLSEIKINWLNNLSWSEQVIETCAGHKFELKFKGKHSLAKNFDLAEEYWLNLKNGKNSLNPEIEDSYFSIYATQFIWYDDVKEIIFDMNKMFRFLNEFDY
jgi:phosphatidate phosphatase PAH1